MRKVFLVLFCILLSSGVFAISSDLKESYEPKETMIVELKGNFLEPIKKDMVDFKRGHVSVPLEFDVKRLGSNYYIWAIAPENVNNYTLTIDDVSTTVAGNPSKVDFAEDFIVQGINGSVVDYNIKPGFIFTQTDFEIEIELNQDESKAIDVDFPFERPVILKPGKNAMNFDISEVVGTQLIKVSLGRYTIPSYIIGSGEIQNGSQEEDFKLRFKPQFLESVVLFDEIAPVYPVQLINFGEEEIIVELEFNDEIFYVEEFEEIRIGPNSAYDLDISFNSFPENGVEETIYARSGNFSVEMPIVIDITENSTEVVTPYLEPDYNNSNVPSCSELDGLVCTADGES
jgi:hypothetical protein